MGVRRFYYKNSPPVEIQIATYFLQAENGLIKIGECVEGRIEHRLKEMCAISPIEIVLLGYTYDHEEDAIHRQFEAHRVRGEWFFPHIDLLKFIDANIERKTFPEPQRNRKRKYGWRVA